MPKGEFQSSPAEAAAIQHITKAFDSSKRYWSERHSVQKRLWVRFKNVALRVKATGYTNLQTGLFYYLVDIIYSVLKDALLSQRPFGKVTAVGNEDFSGKEAIDHVHVWQNNQADLISAHEDSLLYSVATGTGVKIPGWEYKTVEYTDREERTIKLVNPLNPQGEPIELPTGEYEEVQKQEQIDRISCISIPPWRFFPTAGAASLKSAREKMYLVPLSRKELSEMEKDGYIQNLDKVESAAYGNALLGETYLDEYPLKRAKRETENTEDDKDTLWVIYYYGLFPLFNFKENVRDEDAISPDDVKVLMIKPLDDSVILKMEQNTLPDDPCVIDKYNGAEDEIFGTSCMEIVEQLIVHYEDVFGYAQDAATREVFRTLIAPKSLDQSQLTPRRPDAIATMPDAFFEQGKKPFYLEQGTTILTNLLEQRRETRQFIDEVTSVLEFLRGGTEQADETATKTAERARYLNKRFKSRIEYYEQRGIRGWMHWQAVLNHRFLDDEVVAQIAGIAPWENPFKQIIPLIPMISHDFIFEGSAKAADDPVKAQILKDAIEMAKSIPPGPDAEGNFKAVNLLTMFEEFLQKVNVSQDLEKFFINLDPEQMALMQALQGGGQGGGGQGGIGAVTPGDMLSGVRPNAGVRKETTR